METHIGSNYFPHEVNTFSHRTVRKIQNKIIDVALMPNTKLQMYRNRLKFFF